MRDPNDDQYWLDDYTSRGLITIQQAIGLDAALAQFAPELKGYVVADDAEPWTVNTATTAAAATGRVVVTPNTIAAPRPPA